MKENEVIENLGVLAKLKGLLENFQQELDELEDQAFLNCPDLNVRRHELIETLAMLSGEAAGHVDKINIGVLEKGESIKGELLQAVFSTGRTTWDTKALVGYAVAHPEIEKLKKVGKPSVSIREVKDKNQS